MRFGAARLKVKVFQREKCVAEQSFESFPIIFGRSPDCHLHLSSFKFISRSHGSITVNQDKIQVTDLNSANGIRFNKNKVSKFVLIKSGSFEVQDLTFKLELESSLHAQSVTNLGKTQVGRAPISTKSELTGALAEKKFEWRRMDFSIEPDHETRKLHLHDMSVQGTLFWHDEIYDVRNFALSDRIKLGPRQTEPLYVPIMNGGVDFGMYSGRGAHLAIPKNYGWRLYREGIELPFQHLLEAREIKDTGQTFVLMLALNEVLSIDIGYGMKFQLRYVPIPRPLISKTWIENRDEFRRAITTSLTVHFALSVLAVMMAPKPQGPKVKDVPPRFAKLLVEPPKQTFAFEPPPLPPVPPPPPEPEPEAPKQEPKPIVEKKVKSPQEDKKIVKKVKEPKPVVTAVEKPAVPPPPPPPPEQVAAQEMANLFSSMPSPGGGSTGSTLKNAPIVIAKGAGSPAKSGVRVSGIASAAAESPVGEASTGGAGLGLGATAGQSAYATVKGSKAGMRGVSGAVVGAPSFKGVDANQGISNDEVMKVVNRFLGDIHRCYERALFNDSNLVGRVEYEWEISPRGEVGSVSVKRSEVTNGDFLNSCVMGVFKKMKFPAAKNGQTTTANIGFPFGKN